MTMPARHLVNDPDAVRETLRALLPHVRRWLYRLLGRSPDLDDATQEALAEIAAFLPRFEGRSKLETAALAAINAPKIQQSMKDGELRGTLNAREFKVRIARDVAFWRSMIKQLGITIGEAALAAPGPSK